MGTTGAAYYFRRMTISPYGDEPTSSSQHRNMGILERQGSGHRRRSSAATKPKLSVSSVGTQCEPPYIPFIVYRNPSRPPSYQPPSVPHSRPASGSLQRNSYSLSRNNTVRSQYLPAISENIGRVKWEEYRRPDVEEATEEEPTKPKIPITKRILKIIKILLPHVGLNILLLSYIAFGAGIFIWLEADNELQGRKAKLASVTSLYKQIINESISMSRGYNSSYVEKRIRPLLQKLSATHEYDDRFTDWNQMWTDDEKEMDTKWTFAAATLYALTVITSTGYDHVTPTTDPGRIFTVFFGLIGIPLMFITAADIGKFLSEIVIRSYAKLLEAWKNIASIVEMIRAHLFDGDVDSIDSVEMKKKHRKPKSDDDESEEDEEERLQLPIASYFALIVGYCCIGSILFNTFEKGPIWSFIHGVFFSFNTITTIGLGNIKVMNHFYLALSVFYVIIGLAVITASLDLCSSTLKRTFTKLHYFGRKIRGARRGFANMSDDIREAMRIIAALKKTRPSKERITLEDLKRFLEVQEHLLRQPYVPYNVHLMRWIEDNAPNMYTTAYMDDISTSNMNGYMGGMKPNGRTSPLSPSKLSHKLSNSDPMLFY